MASEIDITLKDRLNYTKYARFIHKLCPGTMQQAFKWLYIGKSTSIKDFQNEHPEKFPDIKGADLKAIQNGQDVSDMDVTLLYKLMQRICSLSKPNNPIWYRKPEKERPLEFALHQLKNCRNDACHGNPETFMKVSDEKLKDEMKKLRSLCEKVLVLSAKRAGIPDKTKNKAVNKMRDDFLREFRSEDTVSDEEFKKICREELRHQSKEWSAASYVLPRLQKISPSGDADIPPFPLNQLLECHTGTNEKPKIIIVSGDTGGGKTSLCSFLRHSWSHGVSAVEHLQDYDLLIPVHCGNILTRDLQYLLRSKIMPNSFATLDVAELLDFLKRKKILWVYDGWDEATKEAVGLLTDLLRDITDQFSNHTVLITSRPHVIDELMNRTKLESVLTLSLLGFNEKEAQELLQIKAASVKAPAKSLKNCAKVMRDFAFHFEKPLRNPLALELMINMWIENPDQEGLEKGYSLSQLYFHVTETLKKQVLRRLVKEGTKSENTYKEQIAKWLEMLHKAAFACLRNHEGLKLTTKLVKSLERDFDPDLAKICLSTFLEHRAGRYLFSHPTQINFHASLHILNALSEAADVEKECDNIFEQNLSKFEYGNALDPCLGSYDILQQCASTFQTLISKVSNGIYWPHLRVKSLPFTSKQILWKTIDLVTDIYTRRITNRPNGNKLYSFFQTLLEIHTTNIFPQLLLPMKSLAKLIHNSLEGTDYSHYWFEIIRMSNYDKLLSQEISYYIDTDEWILGELHLKAAEKLMSYTLPCRIVLTIGGELEEKNNLKSVLQFLASQRIEVHLLLTCHSSFMTEGDLSNEYLNILLEDKAKCRLTSFEGQLDINGLQTLIKAKDLQSLTIKTKDGNAIKSLHRVINRLKKLASLTLVLDMKSYPSPRARLETGSSSYWWEYKKSLSVNLVLPHIHATNIVDASRFVSKFCQDYKIIHLVSLSQRRVNFFISKLENVTVASIRSWPFIRHLTENNIKELFVRTLMSTLKIKNLSESHETVEKI